MLPKSRLFVKRLGRGVLGILFSEGRRRTGALNGMAFEKWSARHLKVCIEEASAQTAVDNRTK